MSADSDPGNLDYTSTMKPWVLRFRKPIGVIAGVVFLAVFLAVAYPYASAITPASCKASTMASWWLRISFALWTIAVPVWFFIEFVYGVDYTKISEPNFKSHRDELKGIQEAARSVWAGCAAALAVLLWKLGEG